MRYLVRCISCDRAFWQVSRALPLPEHTLWERRAAAHAERAARCEGSGERGYWIGEGIVDPENWATERGGIG